MLKYALERLRRRDGNDDDELRWLCGEGFLLHYRNLLEVFGGLHDGSSRRPRTTRPGDLTINNAEEWAQRKLFAENQSLVETAQESDRKYYDDISRYLQHCTMLRLQDRSWDEEEMFAALRAILDVFEKELPADVPARN